MFERPSSVTSMTDNPLFKSKRDPDAESGNAEDRIPTEVPSEEDDHRWPPLYTRMIAAMAALNSCNIGYDLGVNTGLVSSFQRGGDTLYMTNGQLEMYMAAMQFTSIFGGLFMFALTNPFGRRGVFLISQVILLIGLSITICSNEYGVLVLGRLITGYAIGTGFAVDPLYISEIAPKKYRGQLVSWSETATNVGILLGFVLSYALRNVPGNAQWKTMIGIGMVLPVVLILLVIFVIPESPRWLMMMNKKEEAAIVLERCSHSSTSAQGTKLVDDLEQDIKEELSASAGVTWESLFQDPVNWRKLKAGVGVAVAGALTGIDGVQYYMFSIFKGAGMTSRNEQFQALILVGIVKLLVISVGGYCFDMLGRRPLLIASNLGLSAALFRMAATHNNRGHFAASAVAGVGFLAVVSYVSFFSLGMGPGAWLVPSEVFSNDIRAKATSFSSFCNRTVAMVVAASFLSMETSMGFGVYIFYGLLTACSATYIYFMLPESRGRSLEQMHEVFQKFE